VKASCLLDSVVEHSLGWSWLTWRGQHQKGPMLGADHPTAVNFAIISRESKADQVLDQRPLCASCMYITN